MGNGYNHHHHHLHNLHKSTFLPMLCSKPSIKDATVPKYGDHHRSFSDDPLSPRVGCMGQVKRHSRIMGFPTITTTTTTTTSCKFTTTTTTSKFNCSSNINNNNNNIRYFKLKKLFSGKNLVTPTTTITTAATSISSSTSSSCGSGKQAVMDNCHFGFNDIIDPPINVADLDPPLPVVIKKVQKREDSGDADNLWRRRKLRNMQIQQIQIPNQCLQPTSV